MNALLCYTLNVFIDSCRCNIHRRCYWKHFKKPDFMSLKRLTPAHYTWLNRCLPSDSMLYTKRYTAANIIQYNSYSFRLFPLLNIYTIHPSVHFSPWYGGDAHRSWALLKVGLILRHTLPLGDSIISCLLRAIMQYETVAGEDGGIFTKKGSPSRSSRRALWGGGSLSLLYTVS